MANFKLEAKDVRLTDGKFITNLDVCANNVIATSNVEATYFVGSGKYLTDISGSANTDGLVSNTYLQAVSSTFGTGGVSNTYLQTELTTKASNAYIQAQGYLTVETGDVSNTYLQTELGNKLDASSYTASDVLTKIKTVDGSGSGLDADTIDGFDSSQFLRSDVSDTKTANINFPDNVRVTFGDDDDFQIFHSGVNTQLNNYSGTLQIVQRADDLDAVIYTDDGSGGVTEYVRADGSTGETILSHYGSHKLATKSTGIDVVGNITVDGTVDGRDVATDGSKLDGIEAGATADQTASEILTAIKTVDGSGSGLDADLLDGISSASFLRSDTSDSFTSGTLSFSSGADLQGGLQSKLGGFYTPQNPEGIHLRGHTFFNDIAYARLRGSTISVDVDGTPMTSTTNIDKMLSPTSDFWNMSTSGVTTVTITITSIPATIRYSSYMGVNFGNTNWRAKDITLEYSTDNGLTYSTAGTFTDQGDEFVISSLGLGFTPANALRWTLEDFNTTSMRINGLFAYDYNSPGMTGLYLPLGGGTVYGDIGVDGTVDGRDVAADGSKLDGIESGATADQTAAEILTAIKTVDGTTSGLDADLLDGVELSALASNAYMTSYVNSEVSSLVDSAPGTLDTLNELAAALGDDPNFATTVTTLIGTKLDSSSYTAADVLTKIKTVDGTTSGLDADLLDGQEGSYYLDYTNFTNTPSVGDVSKVGTPVDNQIGVWTGDGTIEGDADFTWSGTNLNVNGQATFNYTSTSDPVISLVSTDAGSSASPEMELYKNSASPADGDYLGQLKFAGENSSGGKKNFAKITGKVSDVTAGAEDGLIEFALQKAGSLNIGARLTHDALKLINGTALEVDGNITVTGNVDGRDVAADGTKLDGIETNATADQTAAEILTAIKTVDGASSGLDADLLDGQEGSYYLDYNNFTNTPAAATGDVSNTYLQSAISTIDQTNFDAGVSGNTFSHSSTNVTFTEVFVNGIRLDSTDFTHTGGTVNILMALESTDDITVIRHTGGGPNASTSVSNNYLQAVSSTFGTGDVSNTYLQAQGYLTSYTETGDVSNTYAESVFTKDADHTVTLLIKNSAGSTLKTMKSIA